MNDEQATEIAEKIMHEQNVDNLNGFGELTMNRVKAMLMTAAKRGGSTVVCDCGGTGWDHRRLMKATSEAAHWKAQAANLQDVLDAQFYPDEVSLRRRIVMQRREIKAAWQSSAMYQRMWRRAKGDVA